MSFKVFYFIERVETTNSLSNGLRVIANDSKPNF